jgi:exosortase/archaeosortase family protein
MQTSTPSEPQPTGATRPPLSSLVLVFISLLGLVSAEYVLLRYLFRFLAHVKIGWGPWLTDYDLLIPLPTAALLLSYVCLQHNPRVVRFSRRACSLHLVALACFVCFTLCFSGSEVTGVWKILWWGLALCSFSSALALFFDVGALFSRAIFPATLGCVLIATLPTLFRFSSDWIWESLAGYTAHGSLTILRVLLGPKVQIHTIAGAGIWIGTPDLYVEIAKGCTGLDGLLLSFLVGCVALTFPKRLSAWKWAQVFLSSCLLVFTLNVVRVAGLIYLGGLLVRTFGFEQGFAMLQGVFHAHLGWVLYLFGLFLVYWMHDVSFFSSEKTKPPSYSHEKISAVAQRICLPALALFLIAISVYPRIVRAEAPPCNTSADCGSDYCVCSPTNCTSGVCVGSFMCSAGPVNQSECEDTFHYYNGADNGLFCVWDGSNCNWVAEGGGGVPEFPPVAVAAIPFFLACLLLTRNFRRYSSCASTGF